MKFNLYILCVCAIYFASSEAVCPTNHRKVVCYFASWAIYREGVGKMRVDHIDPNMCTHLVYTFAGLSAPQNAIISLDPWNDLPGNGGQDSYRKFIALKEKNPCVKTLLAIGGWNEASLKYSVVASTAQSREIFAESILRYLAQYEFDGIDFDWEYPAGRGGIPADKQNFIELLKVIKQKLQPWKFLLTLAVAVSADIAASAYDIKQIAGIVDYVSLMAYDYTSPTSATTGLLAPLHPKDSTDKTPTIDKSVDLWIKGGCPVSKLVLGIPFYARTFKLKDKTLTGINAPTVQNTMDGRFTKEIGFLSYYEMEEMFLMQNYTVTRNSFYQNNYASNSTYWVTYDDIDTIKNKVKYAIGKGLAGVMAWSIDTDDFQAVFSENKYPLLSAINDAIQ